jgi:hypothetical protein
MGFEGIASNGRLLQVNYSLSPGRVFEGLSIPQPSVKRAISSALESRGGTVDYGMTLCSCMAVTGNDFVKTLNATDGSCIHEWLTYRG